MSDPIKQRQREALAKLMAEKPATNDGERWVYEHLKMTIEHPALADLDAYSSRLAKEMEARIGGSVDFLKDPETGHVISGLILNTPSSWTSCVDLAKDYGFAIENITGRDLGRYTPRVHPLTVLLTHSPAVSSVRS